MSFEIVAGDLEPDMQLNITVNSVAKDISAAVSYQLRWRKPDGTVELVALDAVDLTTGRVKRVWEAGDTDQVGIHRGQVVVTWTGTEPQTFPSDGSFYYWFINPQLT
jgi:hypothetical protein